MTTYTYYLINRIDSDLNLIDYTDEISVVIQSIGGQKIRVYKRGYRFDLPENKTFSNCMKRKLGKKMAEIDDLGCHAIIYNYKYKSGKQGKSVQLFKRKL